METLLILGGLELGLKAMQIWSEYNAELLALQQRRMADGKTLTQDDIDVLLEKTHAKLAANHGALAAAAAAQEASLRGY